MPEPKRSPARSGRSVKSVGMVDGHATNVRVPDDSVQFPASVWRHGMALFELQWIDDEARVRIPHDDVGVVAGSEAALAVMQVREARGPLAHPLCDSLHPRAPGARTGPHRRKRELERRNPS